MRIYGYEDTGQPVDTVIPSPLAEITLKATAAELRSLADFLRLCADEMDRIGAHFDHLHLSDRFKEFRTSPHFVVFRD